MTHTVQKPHRVNVKDMIIANRDLNGTLTVNPKGQLLGKAPEIVRDHDFIASAVGGLKLGKDQVLGRRPRKDVAVLFPLLVQVLPGG